MVPQKRGSATNASTAVVFVQISFLFKISSEKDRKKFATEKDVQDVAQNL